MNFRLGSTSYVYPADILPNVQRLAGLVEDVELVLFEIPQASNLPDIRTIEGLREVARRYRISYTVHLPTDLQLGAERDVWAFSVEDFFSSRERVLSLLEKVKHWKPD
ncbi:MAG: hypothetical protein D6793_05375 [Thermoflexia bacterium]|nr:MAG: hypothetical protein D6793_05375 [Thermoflexia bacterium]